MKVSDTEIAKHLKELAQTTLDTGYMSKTAGLCWNFAYQYYEANNMVEYQLVYAVQRYLMGDINYAGLGKRGMLTAARKEHLRILASKSIRTIRRYISEARKMKEEENDFTCIPCHPSFKSINFFATD